MNNLLQSLHQTKEKAIRELRVIKAIGKEAEQIISNMPKEIIEQEIICSAFPVTYTTGQQILISLWLPYIPALITRCNKYLKELNCEDIRERDSLDKSDLYLSGIIKYEKGEIEISFTFRGKSQNSTCFLVPIQGKKVIKTEVQLYDRVCPDSHPDLFDKDGEGNWIYIGDNVFPALEGE